jgi:putative addiction module component (TIGR02574 family)
MLWTNRGEGNEGESMSMIDDLFNLARELPEPDRAALAHRLLLSLEADAFDPDSQAAWVEELEARLAKVEQGQFAARYWREAVADIRQSLSEKPPS